MLKLTTLIALFICFVSSDSEHDVDTQLPSRGLQISKSLGEENKPAFQTIKGRYEEENKHTKPCKENKNRRQGDNENSDIFESLPLTATTEQRNTATIGKKILSSSVYGASFGYKNDNRNTEAENRNLNSNSKSCGCSDCVLEANKKVLQFESLALDNNGNAFDNAALELKSGEPEQADSSNNPLSIAELDVKTEDFLSDNENKNSLESPSLNIDSDENKTLCKKEFNRNTRRQNCGKFNALKKIKITQFPFRRILPGINGDSTNQDLEGYQLNSNSPQFDNNNDAETRHNVFPNVQKVSNTYGIDLVHNMNINEVSEPSAPTENPVESQLIEPTKGKGVYDMKDVGVMLLENSRVCYACSTMGDPTCWAPNRRTTVKYCRKGHQSCLTKSFTHNGNSVIIRDCGSFCSNYPNGDESYSSCSICHSDLCNGASPLNFYSIGVAIIVIIGTFFNINQKW